VHMIFGEVPHGTIDDAVKDAIKKRNEGGMKRDSLARLKPWEAEGIDRATWYRRRKAQAATMVGKS
jgi:hypothetical protein